MSHFRQRTFDSFAYLQVVQRTMLFVPCGNSPWKKIKASVLQFQALSYAWGRDDANCTVFLYDIEAPGQSAPQETATESVPGLKSFQIRENLYQALIQIRQMNSDSWIWVDALCIDQTNEREKQ